ncbi:hypothetical protein V5G24_23095 [Xanthobacter sp. VTT E-85241]|uniref:hypothetical protein n=1 Tax=Roseixanthobacter finlandensis TaxID=3119922 RepID=UPI00372ADDA2
MLAQVSHAALTHADVRRNPLSAPTLKGAHVHIQEMRGLLFAVLAEKRNAVFESDTLAHFLMLFIHRSHPV